MTFRVHHTMMAPSIPTDAGTLARSVMLVYLRVSAWSGLRQDKRANGSVAAAHGSKLNATRVSKHLIPPEALAPVISAAGAIRAFHYRLTLPWLDDGARILSAAGFFDYKTGMLAAVEKFQDEARKLAGEYPRLVSQAQSELGDLFNPRDYPRDIAGKFDADTTFLPFPTSDDFRVAGINGAEAEIKGKLDSLPAVVEAKAREEIGARVTDACQRIVERMKAYTGGKAGSFRDSLVENVRELVDVLPLLNVANDPRIADLTADLSSMAGVDPDALRESTAARDAIAAQAAEIIHKMEGFI